MIELRPRILRDGIERAEKAIKELTVQKAKNPKGTGYRYRNGRLERFQK